MLLKKKMEKLAAEVGARRMDSKPARSLGLSLGLLFLSKTSSNAFDILGALLYIYSTAGALRCKRARGKGKAVGKQAYINFGYVFWVAVFVGIFK